MQKEESVNFYQDVVYRPKTRGELYELLSSGKKCEVAEYSSDITSSMLRSLIIMKKSSLEFKMYPSIHRGWVIFEAL